MNTPVKKNHHYVPQFWLRGFRDGRNQLHARVGSAVKVVATADVMQEAWLYTLFDSRFHPSDTLEDELSNIEGDVAPIFVKLNDASQSLTANEEKKLYQFLGLQACRHPDILNRGFRRAREMARLIASVHDYTNTSEFVSKLQEFGLGEADGKMIHEHACTKTAAELGKELRELEDLSPQDPKLPVQIATLSFDLIAKEICALALVVLDAPAGKHFALGDTPMPQSKLAAGFTVPISKSVALAFSPKVTGTNAASRRLASAREVTMSNLAQWRDAREVVVGPDPQILRALCHQAI